MQLPCLDIIIPHYSEKPEMIRHLLDSIEGQVGVDLAKAIRVTIVNDKNDNAYNELSNYVYSARYTFPVTVYQVAENGGAGRARQFGIDRTNLPYIMFCDADDQLYASDSLMKILNYVNLLEVQNKKWNYVWGDFYEEQKIGEKGYNLLKHDTPSMIWMHGKIFNRSFLEEHNIKFHPWLRTFEDTYFGKCVGLSAQKSYIQHCPEIIYLWKRNPDSVTSNWTKDQRSYLYWRNVDYIECTYKVLEFIYPHRVESGRWNELFFVSLMFTYFILQTSDFDRRDEEASKIYDNMEDLFVRLTKDFGETVRNSSAKERAYWYSMVRQDVCNRFGLLIEKVHWNHFLQHIDNKYHINSYELFYIKDTNLQDDND